MCARDVSQELLRTNIYGLPSIASHAAPPYFSSTFPCHAGCTGNSRLTFPSISHSPTFAVLLQPAGTYSLLPFPFPTLFAFTQGHHLGVRGFRQSRVLLSQFLTASEASLLSCSRVPPRRQPFDHGYRCAVTRLLRPIIATLPRSVIRLPKDSRPPSSPAGPPESAYKESSFPHDC